MSVQRKIDALFACQSSDDPDDGHMGSPGGSRGLGRHRGVMDHADRMRRNTATRHLVAHGLGNDDDPSCSPDDEALEREVGSNLPSLIRLAMKKRDPRHTNNLGDQRSKYVRLVPMR